MPVPSPKAVFLSYASQDGEAAQRLCAVLRAAGIEVWLDQSELRGGDAWDQKIKKQIRECALFLPLISANTNARAEGYFRLEWKLAVDRSHLMADDAPFLVPAVIDAMNEAAARVPDRFRDVQWTRLLTPDAAAVLAARVRALLGGTPEPAPEPTRMDSLHPAGAGTKAGPISAPGREPLPTWRPTPDHVVPGTKWTLEKKLGEGGFGEAWLARHQTMKERRVFKFCLIEERVRSLKRELTLFRVIKERVGGHPNIVRLLDVHFEDPPYYVEMDYVDGQDLKSWCAQQGGVEKIPLATRLELVAQIADALHAAHSAGVVHRDVKPGNILVAHAATPGGQPVARLSDFGIGQVTSEEALSGVTKSGFTQSIVVDSSSARSGTQLYMAPELLVGNPASARTDVHSLGVVLFQLVAGDLHRPLTTDWSRAVEDPVLLEDLTRCFASREDERFGSADELARSLRAFATRRAVYLEGQAAAAARQVAARRWRLFRTVAVGALVVGLGASVVWFLQRNSRIRWARQEALPEINRLVQVDDIPAAFALAIEAEKFLPDDPALTSLWPKIAVKTSITTTPPGAEVSTKHYRKPGAAWQVLGKAPLKDLRLPKAYFRWQIRLPGFETVERAAATAETRSFNLIKTGEIPPGMVFARGRMFESQGFGLRSAQLFDYFIDRHEVSHRQFKEFVEGGGYTKADFWKQPFVKDGRTIPWAEAVAEFRDSTGRPGPATWKNGTFPVDEADHPVTGISWFEAAAFAEFVGKRLPSIYHWRDASGLASAESIIPLSNFSGQGLAPVGSNPGMSACGAYDMAGNAKEWCWNEARPGERYLLGGGWSELPYMYAQTDAQSPFNRSALHGFRCMKPATSDSLAAAVDAPHVPSHRDYAAEKPASDEEFQAFRSLFAYDRTPLEERIEAVDDGDPRWRREKITFVAAYGGERMTAILFLPKGFSPPYQTVVFFPGANAINAPSSDNLVSMERIEFVVGGGRALLYPIYKGTYERHLKERLPRTSIAYRDLIVTQSKDLSRSLDYLETRRELQRGKLAYVGLSMGAATGVVLTAMESRIKVNVFVIGGFWSSPTQREVDQIHFAPRVKVPILMLNGNSDFTFPVESAQRPMFQALGTAPEHKRHVLFNSGHSVPIEPSSKEIRDWLDNYLGPVK